MASATEKFHFIKKTPEGPERYKNNERFIQH